MEIRHLRYFVAVAEELSFTRAAAVLHVAQSAVSAQIRFLEDSVGVTLLERNSRRVELTGAGHIFLQGAKKIIIDLEEISQTDTQNRSGGDRASGDRIHRRPEPRVDASGSEALSPQVSGR